MFYSVELLSIRQNAKFAKCWLAANLTPKAFHNKFRRHTVAAINIPRACGELITYINTHSSQYRMSLYLSSQLMFGVTRILYYQTRTFLEVQWELWNKASAFSGILEKVDVVGKKKRKKLPVLPRDGTLLPLQEPPASVHTLKNKNVVDERIITLPEAYSGGEAIREPDWPNFGALTAVELDQMLEPGGLRLDESPPSVRVFPDIVDYSTPHVFRSPSAGMKPRATRKGTIDVDQIPNGNGILTEIPLPEPQDEISSITVPQPLGEEPPRTPVKRKLSPPSVMETPPTKKKGSEVRPEPVAPVVIPAPIDEPPGPIDLQPPEPMPIQASSNDISLDTLESGVYRLKPSKKKSRKLIIDFDTKLAMTQSPREQKKTPKPAIELRSRSIQLQKITAAELLKTPSSWQVLGKQLLARYKEIILAPILQTAVSSNVPDAQRHKRPSPPVRDLPIEPVRSPEVSVDEQPPNMSDVKKPMTSTDISKTDQTTTSEHLPIQEGSQKVELPPGGLDDITGPVGQLDTLPELPGDDIEQQPPPNISNLPITVRNIARDWVENGQPQGAKSSPARESTEKNIAHLTSTVESGDTSTSRSSAATWLKADILGGLEVQWRQKRILCFKDICAIATTTNRDAARVFVLLLELHKSKNVKLTQAAPYRDIYIQKYSSFF